MAIQKLLKFAIPLVGDGTSTVIAVDFTKNPVLWNDTNTQYEVSHQFSSSTTAINGIIASSLSSDNGIAVTATVSAGVATFTFASAPSNGASFTITGWATVA